MPKPVRPSPPSRNQLPPLLLNALWNPPSHHPQHPSCFSSSGTLTSYLFFSFWSFQSIPQVPELCLYIFSTLSFPFLFFKLILIIPFSSQFHFLLSPLLWYGVHEVNALFCLLKSLVLKWTFDSSSDLLILCWHSISHFFLECSPLLLRAGWYWLLWRLWQSQ